jgi:hypothetical protein
MLGSSHQSPSITAKYGWDASYLGFVISQSWIDVTHELIHSPADFPRLARWAATWKVLADALRIDIYDRDTTQHGLAAWAGRQNPFNRNISSAFRPPSARHLRILFAGPFTLAEGSVISFGIGRG